MITPVTLVIPCKNEALRLDPEAFLRGIEQVKGLSCLFVDDGSTDSTASVLAHLALRCPAIDALYLPQNVGKAEAVRAGIRRLLELGGTGFVGFWDADLATPLAEVSRFIWTLAQNPSVQMAIGSRWPHLGAHIDRSVFRNCAGSVMKFMIRRVLSAPVYDTQCGAKVMTRELAAELFARPFVSRWLFDVELFRRMGRNRILQSVREVPLDNWYDVEGSKMTLASAAISFVDLFRIAFKGREMVEYPA